MGAGLLERIEGVCGQLTPDLIGGLDPRTPDRRILMELWHAFNGLENEDTHGALPPLRTDGAGRQPRPYFAVHQLHRRQSLQLNLAPADFADRTRVDASLATLSRYLLYCGSVAVDDPMWFLVRDRVWEPEREPYRGRLLERWPSVVNALQFYAATRPLLVEERLILVPYSGGITYPATNPVPPVGGDDVAAISDLDMEDVRELQRVLWGRQSLLTNDADDKRLALEEALHVMESQMQIVEYFEGRVDISTDTMLDLHALRKLLGAIPNATETARLHTLATLPVFDVEAEAHLLVALARSSDDFAAWRVALGRALDSIDALDAGRVDFDAEARRVLTEALFDPVSKLRDNARRASWKGNAKLRLGDVALGGVGVGAAAAVAAAFGAATLPWSGPGLVAAAGVRFLWTVSHGRGARRQAKAADELYKQFGLTDADRR